ncbi:MAG TPA: hypothetical protein ENK18_20370, partial [Deltaproteobacteria bacterium]|nr:hypothetical protein [Deltaproteobacteria bacterium]
MLEGHRRQRLGAAILWTARGLDGRHHQQAAGRGLCQRPLRARPLVVLAIFPVALIGISIRARAVVAGASRRRLGTGITAATAATVMISLLLAFAITTRQPQHHARHPRRDRERRRSAGGAERHRRGASWAAGG